MTKAADASARRQPGRPALGRETPLTREAIIDRADEIVQSEGLDALSMRRLARDLGVTPMAIYHHVPDKPALVDALLKRVWSKVTDDLELPMNDPIEALIAFCIRTYEVWLEHIELAILALGVADPDDEFFRNTLEVAVATKFAGFPDVPLAATAVQIYTMGAISTTAIRRTSSAYFGRDPDAILERATTVLREGGATADQIGVVEGRFDVGEHRAFEPGLRALLRGLRHPDPPGA